MYPILSFAHNLSHHLYITYHLQLFTHAEWLIFNSESNPIRGIPCQVIQSPPSQIFMKFGNMKDLLLLITEN